MSNRCGFLAWLALLVYGTSTAMAADACTLDPAAYNPVCDCACETICAPVWNVSAEALWLNRASSQQLLTAAGPVGPNVADAELANTFEPGLRLEVRRLEADGSAWELGYFGLNQWNNVGGLLGDPVGRTVLVSSPLLQFDDQIGGFDIGGGYSHSGRIQNVELNRWAAAREYGRGTITPMFGVRWFEFRERLTIFAEDSIFGSELFDAASYNALLGAQVGFKAERHWNQLEGYVIGKAGLYGNNFVNRVSDVVFPAVGAGLPPIDAVNSGIGVAGLLELRVGAKYLLTDNLALTGGYTLMYVPGLTLQPSTNGIGGGHDDGLVLHGLSLGAEVAW